MHFHLTPSEMCVKVEKYQYLSGYLTYEKCGYILQSLSTQVSELPSKDLHVIYLSDR